MKIGQPRYFSIASGRFVGRYLRKMQWGRTVSAQSRPSGKAFKSRERSTSRTSTATPSAPARGVRHPMTGKLLAVVTSSCDMTPRADLLKPLLSSVTQTLEQHVLDVEQPAARRVFNTFLEVSRAQPDPVVAFGPQGLLIQNPQAGRFSGDDLERIRQASSEDASGGRHTVDLSTRRVGVQIMTVEPGNKIVVVLEQDQRSTRIGSVHSGPDKPSRRLVGRSAEWLSVAGNVAKHRGSPAPLIIAGESDVGSCPWRWATPPIRAPGEEQGSPGCGRAPRCGWTDLVAAVGGQCVLA
jgi:hypothetical protein